MSNELFLFFLFISWCYYVHTLEKSLLKALGYMFISFTISVSKHLSFGLGLCDKSKFMDVMMNFF